MGFVVVVVYFLQNYFVYAAYLKFELISVNKKYPEGILYIQIIKLSFYLFEERNRCNWIVCLCRLTMLVY
jgi:hypothetical protein